MKGIAIDRLLAVYNAAYVAHVSAGGSPAFARENARGACDDFTRYIEKQSGAIGAGACR